MGKGHRDNHRARKKRGAVAFERKRARRSARAPKCNHCGNKCRIVKQVHGLCPQCREVMGIKVA